MKKVIFLCFNLATAFAQQDPGFSFEAKPFWVDNFDGSGQPNAKHWTKETGGHGFGNHEKQFYTENPKNAYLKKGHLHIKAIKENVENNEYTSAKLTTKGKVEMLYGKVEVRAKLPVGRGTWPAIWMMPASSEYGNKSWPDNGEIDIMEHVGYDQNRVHGNVHTAAFNHTIGTNKGNRVQVKDASQAFHVYSLEWTPTAIRMAVDGIAYFTFEKQADYTYKEWPFDKPFYLILNQAIGGDWGGQKGIDDSVLPQTLVIDYVKMYKYK